MFQWMRKSFRNNNVCGIRIFALADREQKNKTANKKKDRREIFLPVFF